MFILTGSFVWEDTDVLGVFEKRKKALTAKEKARMVFDYDNFDIVELPLNALWHPDKNVRSDFLLPEQI
jgi:hypothetical protein